MGGVHDVPVETASVRLEADGRRWAEAHANAATTVPLAEALGHVLAHDLRARSDHPSIDDSALDGIACRVGDTREASETHAVTLRCIGDSLAGRPYPGTLGAAEAVRIQTGAALPEGADGVVPVERLVDEGEVVRVFTPASSDVIRARGQDLREGAVGLAAGHRLDAAGVGLVATMGHAEVPVRAVPRVAVLSTGDELVTPGGTLAPGQTFDANRPALRALVRAAGARPVDLGHVSDAPDDLASRVRDVLGGGDGPDLIVSCGGISAGRTDRVRELIERDGDVLFRRVRLKPGGPATFAHVRGTPWLALPGNPVSALVTFIALARAWIDRAAGREGPLPFHTRIPAVAGEALYAAGGKTTLSRITLSRDAGRLVARSAGPQSSGILRTLAHADALALLPPHARLEAGDPVGVITLPPHLG